MGRIMDFDDEFDKLTSAEEEFINEGKPIRTGRKRTTPKSEKELAAERFDSSKHKSAKDKLLYDANNKLNYYLKKSPHYKIIEKQIEILETEATTYKKNGNIESYDKTRSIITELKLKIKNLKNIFKTGESTPTKTEKINNDIKNSVELKELRRKRKELSVQINLNTPSHVTRTITKFRKNIALNSNFSSEQTEDEIIDFDSEFGEDENISVDIEDQDEVEMNVSNISMLQQEYYDYCGIIADLSGIDIDTLINEKMYKLTPLIKSSLNPDSLLEEYEKLGYQIQTEKSRITGATQITDLLFEIYDFKQDTEGLVPKEILASSNIPLVRGIAHKMCLSLGMTSYKDDAVSAGLLGLTLAINKWYEKQSQNESALSFAGFASIYISNTIQRDLYSLSNKGRASGSVIATLEHKKNKKLETFLKTNPEFKDVDTPFLNEILAGYDDDFTHNFGAGTIVSETDYTETVGGEDGDSGDIWTNLNVDNDDSLDVMVEAKFEYEKLMKSIKSLLNLFSMKENKAGLLVVNRDKQLFDKYDKKLFLMRFGLSHKLEKHVPGNDTRNGKSPGDFNQGEMAEELMLYAESIGDIGKTFSPEAISDRLKKIDIKMKFAIEQNPELKAGFEYLYNYWIQNNNTNSLKKLSNAREEIGMKIDRDELRNYYVDDEAALETQLSDGSKLSDVFELSDDNLLDDEDDIFAMFNNGEF